MTSSRCEDRSTVLSLWEKRLLDESKMFRGRGKWVFDIWGRGFFVSCCEYLQYILSGGERAECSLALSGTSILSRVPCNQANSACLTSGTSWSTDINNRAIPPAHVPAFWLSPWSPSPSIGEPLGQHAHTQRKRPHNRGGSSVDGVRTAGSVDEQGHVFILSATPEVFISTTHHPLINYTPAMGAPLIMNVFPIRKPLIFVTPLRWIYLKGFSLRSLLISLRCLLISLNKHLHKIKNSMGRDNL